MALRPGGPLGDMVSQNEYATELAQQRQEQQPQQQSDSRQQPQERQEGPKLSPQELEAAAFEKNLAQNERTAERNNAERADKLGPGQQQQPEAKPEKSEQTDEKKNVYQDLAQEVKEQQKQDSPDRQQERQAELGD